MDDDEDNPSGDDEEELPPPHRSPRLMIVIGAIVLIALIAIGSTAAIHAITKATIVPTPTAIDYGPPVPTPWVEPSWFCDQAVQKIEQNQVAYLIVYREKDGGPAIPKNAVTGIEVLPRGISYQGDPAQSNSLLNIYTTYPDHICLPQMLAAVKQTNKSLSKNVLAKTGLQKLAIVIVVNV